MVDTEAATVRPMAARARHVCPICARETAPRDGTPKNPSFPFCSPACKLVDLGKWLDGTYRIPGTATSDDDEASSPPLTEDDG
jgi:uncharacterized protein